MFFCENSFPAKCVYLSVNLTLFTRHVFHYYNDYTDFMAFYTREHSSFINYNDNFCFSV